MTRGFAVWSVLVVCACFWAAEGQARDRYDVFVGEYSAAYRIAEYCDGISVIGEKDAGRIAKSQDGLRKNRVLKLLFYGRRAWLHQEAAAALAARKVDPMNGRQLCRFGRKVVGKPDRIGRFLRRK